jgi:phasin
MADMSQNNQPKAKIAPKPTSFETPKFEMPKYDMPSMEMPAGVREFAEKGIAQAKGQYEKFKAAAEETTDVLESTYTTASKGASEYGLKMIEISRANTNAAFDFFGKLLAVKSLSEAVELSTAHARSQFETMTAQAKELTTQAQKIATDTAEPMKAGLTSAMSKAA